MKGLFLAFSFFVVFSAFNQQYNFINYSLEEGLPQSQVTDICQDQFGYLWIGTETGLSRFDGIKFENFSTDNGLPDNEIDKLFIDHEQKLWVATPKGIALYEEKKFTPYPFSKDLHLEYRINDLGEFNNQIHLGADEGLLLFEKDHFVLLTEGIESANAIRAICNLGDSVLVCGTKNGLFKYVNDEYLKYNYPLIDSLNISDLFLHDHELIISTYGQGLLSHDLISGSGTKYPISANRVRAAHANSESLLCATKNGAIEITKDEVFYYNLKNGLVFENIRCVFIDSENNLWLGTDGKGLFKLKGKSIISYTKRDGLSSDAVMSISQDQEGYYYFGTYEGGLTKWREKDASVELSVFNSDLKNTTVWVAALDKNNRCWVGSSAGIDHIINNQVVKSQTYDHITGRIKTILFLNDSTTLVAGTSGVIRLFDKGFERFFTNNSIDVNKMVVYDDRLFLATTSGLYESSLFGNMQSLKLIELPENNIKTLTVDQSGNLWVGTNSSGIYVYQSDGGIVPFSLDPNDSRSKTILGLISDSFGNIWATTLNGVYQVVYSQESQQFTINHYGRAEGLITLECNQNALYEDYEHNIWVGTSEGLVRINPALNNELFSLQKPKLMITGMRLFMEKFDYSSYEVVLDSINEIPMSITLPYNKNHLTFDFIGINLKDPEGVRYEYRLLDVEQDWSPITEINYATYSFIGHGEYDFEVRATNNSGEWSETKRIHITILPPFWLTWWFVVFMISLGVFVVVIIFQYRIKALKQKQENERLGLKNRLLFLEQQSLNASMNRHFIFNSLNSIQYFINSSNKLAANKYLTSFAKLIRKNLDSSTANNFIVTLKEEIERIELYLSLEKMRFEGKFDYILNLDDNIDPDSIEIPSMLLQPFVENSIIHGVLPIQRKGEITINIFKEFDYLVFEVVDDGFGIDNSLKLKTVKSTGDHESMGMDITNRRIELIRKLTGENLMIIGPFQVNNELGECLGTKVIIKINLENHLND